jgi:hypothetical protein
MQLVRDKQHWNLNSPNWGMQDIELEELTFGSLT